MFQLSACGANIEKTVFQSLVRDGSCFNARSGCRVRQSSGFNPSFGMDRVSTLVAYLDIHPSDVSIPRSGWIVFQRDRLDTLGGRDTVSIPRSGWIVFQLDWVAATLPEKTFQSLVRDGSCFNPSHHQPHSGHTHKCICEQAYLYHRHWDDATRLPFINRVWYQHF